MNQRGINCLSCLYCVCVKDSIWNRKKGVHEETKESFRCTYWGPHKSDSPKVDSNYFCRFHTDNISEDFTFKKQVNQDSDNLEQLVKKLITTITDKISNTPKGTAE